MLAQEQAVIRRGPGFLKGVEASFGAGGESEGTLVLTDRRLVYVHGNEKEEDIPVGIVSPFTGVSGVKKLHFSDVESLDSIPLDEDEASVEIPISSITKVTGRKGEGLDPRLTVTWKGDGGADMSTEFVQQITGSSRRKNLDDWVRVIEKLKAGQAKISPLPPPPSADTLEGRILEALGDMQDKGPLVIEEEVEERYKVDLDPDQVEAACDRLVELGLARKTAPKGEDPYYSKVSPLGKDDLSA
jgi:hypothetical protein